MRQPEPPSASTQVIRLDNIQQGNVPMLIPAVQELLTQEGYLALPKEFTVSLPQEEKLILEQFSDELLRWPEKKVIQVQDKAFCSFALAKKDVPQHPQGYRIEINANGIRVRSRTCAGLFYGAQTLRNMFRNSPGPALKFTRIEDWPDFNRRGYFMTIRRTQPENLPQIKKMFDVLASLKMNWLLLETAEAFPYENNQLTKRTNAFTREQMEDLRDFCRARHLEITPTFQVLSHNLWMTFHPDWPQMRESNPDKPWSSQACLSNLQARNLTKDCILQQINLFKPEIFFLMMDEIEDSQIQKCPVCAPKDHAALLSDYIRFAEDTVKDAGVRPMLCQDSFVTPGSRLPYADKVRASLDKNDMILWWSYANTLNENRIVPFQDFQLAGHALHAKPHNLAEMCKLIKKYGGNDCTVVYWYYSTNGTLENLSQETPDSLGGMVNSCDMMWRFREDYPSYPYDAVYEMMRRLHPAKIPPALPGSQASPVPLTTSINAELNASHEFPCLDDTQLGQLKQLLADTPEHFHFVTAPGKYYGMRVSGSKNLPNARYAISHALNRRASRLSFLLTSSRPRNGLDYLSAYTYGPLRYHADVAAKLKVEYEDGTTAEQPLRFRYEFNEWNRPFGGFLSRNVVRGLDKNSHYFTFGVYDFVNPSPEKKIKSFVFSSNFLNGISPVLLALSAWNLDKPFAPADFAFDTSRIANPYNQTDLPVIRSRTVEDFETGTGSCFLTTDGQFSAPLTMSVIEDPTAPGKGQKVLKISVPPAKLNRGNHSGGAIRFNVELPYTIPADTKTLSLTVRISSQQGFNRCQDYLVAKDNMTHRFYKQTVSTEWTENHRELNAPCPFASPLLKNIPADTVLRRISFFFDSIDKPLELFIDNIGDSPDLLTTAPFWTKSLPAD